jgi:dienelactone hydrolase
MMYNNQVRSVTSAGNVLRAGWILVAGVMLSLCLPWAAQAQVCDEPSVSLAPVVDAFFTRPAPFDWQGDWQQDDDVCFPSRQSGGTLRAYFLAPADIDARSDSLPVVVIGPGSGTGQALYYLWSARALAGHGYLALVVDPQGVGRSDVIGDIESCGVEGCPGIPFQDADNFVDAFASALDFVESGNHPWLAKADVARIGVTGHSLSARAAGFLQGEDERIDALVAWDNLSSDLHGDAGVSSGGGTCGALIGGSVPESELVDVRIPAMGQASDSPPGCDPQNTDPEVKKTGYRYWRDAGTDAMQLVFAGAAHGDWAQTRDSDPAQLQLFQHYTQLWFDRYLKPDEASSEDILQRDVLGQPVQQSLSNAFHSAIFLPDQRVDCPRFAEGVCVPVAELDVVSDTDEALTVLLNGSRSFDPSVDGMLTGYSFDPGDGSVVIHSDSAIVEHRYTRGDVYYPHLVVTNANGLVSVADKQYVLVNRPPVAELNVSVFGGIVPLRLTLDASTSRDDDANDSIRRYLFDPGDGSAIIESAEPTLEYTYNEIGSFGSTVRAVDSHGAISEPASLTVRVLEPPVPPTPGDNAGTPATPSVSKRSSGGGALSPLTILMLCVLLGVRRLRTDLTVS